MDHEKNGTRGYQFIPFGVEFDGMLGEDADRLLKGMLERAVSTGSCDGNGFLCWMQKVISSSLITEDARFFSYYLFVFSKAILENRVLDHEAMNRNVMLTLIVTLVEDPAGASVVMSTSYDIVK